MSRLNPRIGQKRGEFADRTFCSAGEAKRSRYGMRTSMKQWCIAIIVVAVDIPFGIIQQGAIKRNRVGDCASWQRWVRHWD